MATSGKVSGFKNMQSSGRQSTVNGPKPAGKLMKGEAKPSRDSAKEAFKKGGAVKKKEGGEIKKKAGGRCM